MGAAEQPDSPTVNEVWQKLEQLGAMKFCPRCDLGQMSFVEGSSAIPGGSPKIGHVDFGNVIPVATLVCGRCGYVVQHALGVLGFMSKKPEEGK